MKRSFYHFLMKYRHPAPKTAIEQFANDAFLDHSFPKTANEYDDLSAYLELNALYLPSMTVFDEAYELYLIER